jgi:hypothetical protein
MEISDAALANLEEGYVILEMNVTGTIGVPDEIRKRLSAKVQEIREILDEMYEAAA